MATFGKIDEYVPGQNWSEYIERLEEYFSANGIIDVAKKRSILLTVCGSQTYSVIRNLTAPAKPNAKTFTELKELVKDHVSPKPLKIAERFKFYQRKQLETENVNEFLSQLRKLTEFCEFNTFLNEALKDRFVCGLRSMPIQRKLLTEANLTLDRAVTIATGMEAAEIQAHEFNQSKRETAPVNRVNYDSESTSVCYRCGKGNHNAENCFYRNA